MSYRSHSHLESVFFPLLFILMVVGALGTVVYAVHASVQAENRFKAECVEVGGRSFWEDDDLECWKDNREIAEFGENSPKQPYSAGYDD